MIERRSIEPQTDKQPLPEQPAASATAGSSTRKTVFGFLRLAAGIAILVYLWKSGAVDFHQLIKLLSRWPITLAALAILLLDVFLMALRTCWFLRAHHLHLSLGDSVRLTLVSAFFSTFLPGSAGGDIAKMYYAMRENSGRRTEVATILLLDRATGLFSMLLIPLILAPFFLKTLSAFPVLRQLLAFVGAISLLTLLAFLLCLYNDPVRKLLQSNSSTPSLWRERADRALFVLAEYRGHHATLLGTTLLAILDNFLVIAISALALVVLNPSSLSPSLCLVAPLGNVANSLPLTPGGLGVGEAAFSKLFSIVGLSVGAETLLCWRIWKAIVALFGLAIYLRGMGRVVFDKPRPASSNATHNP
jgi:glycosyltransferase 2 family protein